MVCLVLSLKQRRSPRHAQNRQSLHYFNQMCVLQGSSLLQEHLATFSKSSGAWGCHWEELLGKEFVIHLPMTIEITLDPFPTDLVADHYVRVSPEGACDTVPLKAEKSVLVHRQTPTHCLPTFPGVPCQWRTFTLTITCLALITSPWTHQRWPPYAYIDQLCDDSGCLLEDLPNVTHGRNGRRQQVSHGYQRNHDPIFHVTDNMPE